VFITDADVEFVDPRWAVALRDATGGEARVGHPLVLNPDGRVWSAGGRYRDFPEYGFLPADHRLRGELPHDLEPVRVPYAPTVAWFARREVISRAWVWASGFHPTVFADVDLAFWLRSQGVEFWFTPAAHLVHHAGSYTARQSDGEGRRQRFERHAAEFLARWGDAVEHDLALLRLGPDT
jgi:GT2 family glycosyltransferase